jgi:acyl-CoA reductase-like NAD-dependent aldehyde dehydrogenase
MSTELLVLAGERTSAADGASSSVIEPGTGEPMTEVAEASVEDAKRAVDIAVKAFDEGAWRRMNATERGRVLLRASTLFRDRLGRGPEQDLRRDDPRARSRTRRDPA